MISIQSKILLGLFAAFIVGSALLIWIILAWGNGFIAMVTPLAVGAVISFVAYRVIANGSNGPSD